MAISALALFALSARAQDELLAQGTSVLPPNALLTTTTGGLEATNATQTVVPVTGQPFKKALRVVIRKASAETNATQMTINNAAPLEKGDVCLASFFLRGDAGKAGRIGFLFEKSVDPWTKSIAQDYAARGVWKRILIPFSSSETYAPGQVMTSLRFAFGPQTVEIADLKVVNLGKSRKLDDLIALASAANKLGAVNVAVKMDDVRQTMLGFGGDFCQPRYGQTEPMDAVGQYALDHLSVVHARIGLPLNYWTPERGVYKDDAQAHASFLAMKEMTRRNIPLVATVWEGPTWMLGGMPEQSGRVLPPDKYGDCIEAIAQYLVTARDKYGVTVDYFSFNEPDYGINFKFTSETMAAFIRQAASQFAALKLKTKFLTGDTANGASLIALTRPLLEDKTLAPFLGPIAFHCWDVLSAPDVNYAAIAAFGKEFNRPVWCLEAGHDAQLWQRPNPWESWDNGLRTAQAYAKTIALSGASLMDYWTYQNNYPLVSEDGKKPFPVFNVIQQMGEALPPDSRIVGATTDNDDIKIVAARGPKAGYFSVLLVNPIGAGKVTLSGLPPNDNAALFLSDAQGQRKTVTMQATVSKNGTIVVMLPARSVVTLVGGR